MKNVGVGLVLFLLAAMLVRFVTSPVYESLAITGPGSEASFLDSAIYGVSKLISFLFLLSPFLALLVAGVVRFLRRERRYYRK